MDDTKKWIPQFNDGSGWDTISVKIAPYFYEHIKKGEVKKLKDGLTERVFKVICITDYPGQPHKNTYFIKGNDLQKFLEKHFRPNYAEEVISIKEIRRIPSFKKKLTA